MRVAVVYMPVPRQPLSEVERRFSYSFFQAYAKTYFSGLPTESLKHLWQIERVNQGLLYIAANLLKNGFDVSYYAFASDPYCPPRDGFSLILHQLIEDISEIDLVCVYCITCNYHLAETIAFQLKDRKHELIVGLGGPHASSLGTQVLERRTVYRDGLPHDECRSPFDFVCIGEGEETVLEIARCLEEKGYLEPIPGMSVRRNGFVNAGSIRCRRNPVDFPIPAYEIAGVNQLPAARIFPNRGCANNCAFCADPWRKKVTYVTLDRIAEEVELLYSQYGTRYLYLGCEDFLYDQGRALAIATTIHNTRSNILWTAQCRVKPKMDSKIIDKLTKYGCVGLEFGVESAEQTILDRVGKNILVKQAKDCFSLAKSCGIYTHAYWMLGLPGETEKSANLTISTMLMWAEQGLVDTWEYKIYIPYPGTPIFANPHAYGIKVHTKDFQSYHYALDPVISSNGLGPAELRSIYEKGLRLSADLLQSKSGSEEIEIGVDVETIENMF